MVHEGGSPFKGRGEAVRLLGHLAADYLGALVRMILRDASSVNSSLSGTRVVIKNMSWIPQCSCRAQHLMCVVGDEVSEVFLVILRMWLARASFEKRLSLNFQRQLVYAPQLPPLLVIVIDYCLCYISTP